MSELENLCAEAHLKALQQDTQVPAEMYEWMHLPMRRVHGIPVFHEAQMRPDQRDEVVAFLLRYLNPTRYMRERVLAEEVEDYMEAYGRFGLRAVDVATELGMSKPSVLKYLRELVQGGLVRVREEKTRGTGSKRKRYFWTGNVAEYGVEDFYTEGEGINRTDLVVKNDDWRGTEPPMPGRVHGAPVHALSCPSRCSRCEWALEDAFIGEAESDERRFGGTGFFAGLALRRERRIRAECAFAAAIAVGLRRAESDPGAEVPPGDGVDAVLPVRGQVPLGDPAGAPAPADYDDLLAHA